MITRNQFIYLLILLFIVNIVKCEDDQDNSTNGPSTQSQEINQYIKSFKFMVLLGLVLLSCVAIVIYIVLYCKIREERSLAKFQNEWVENKKSLIQTHNISLLSDTDDNDDNDDNDNYSNNNNNNNNNQQLLVEV